MVGCVQGTGNRYSHAFATVIGRAAVEDLRPREP
jgi:hypothetical protein